ncbi:MAG: TIM barrel protein [Terriglobia bacterium]|jgi:hydroxypyruvate isomerase
MDRRSFIGVAAGALSLTQMPTALRANLEGKKGLRLSITWGMLDGMPVPEAMALLNRLGYDAYEMFDWRNPATLETFVAEKSKSQLFCACLVANKGVTAPGCGLVNPREREGFMRELEATIEAAKKMDCRQLVTLTGNELGGMPRAEQMANAVAALREAAPLLEKNGMTAIIEILNTYVNHAGYFLYYVRDGAELVDRVGSPNVKLLFDIYHVQIMEGNLIENIRTNIDRIGHFHVGDVPGRHEPGTGEINYRNVFKAIYDLGDRFQGSVALEYSPLAPLEQHMAAMRALANFT